MIRSLVVAAIVLLAVAYAVPTSRAWLVDASGPLSGQLKARLLPAKLEAMADELERQRPFLGDLPRGRAWEAWLRTEAPGQPEDPWGNLFYLRPDRDGFILGSRGPDGVANNQDDIWVRRNPS